MKILAIAFLLSALLYGQAAVQTPEPVKVAPGTPAVTAPADAAPAPLPPETVVAEVNGKKYTAGDLDKLINMLPAQYQQAARSQPQLLSQVFLMQRLADDAVKAGLDQKPPFKDQLEMSRMQTLSTAELSDVNNRIEITQAEQQNYYNENPDKFKEVKVRVIYVAFNPTPGKAAAGGKKLPTEAEAQAKVEDLEKQIKAGADFGKLARENSDDQVSAAKDGDFGSVKLDSSYPQPIKTAVFALKQGEVSAPLKQTNGFYLIRADEVGKQSFNDAFMQIVQAVKQAKYQVWLKGLQAQYSVKIENPAYFAPRVPAQLQQVH
ncbi:MAG TPA: peptidylprolyl isomerase [Bryobacteraceae bacterium]|nr:peptidylprolyl isomerase [Bryobacteraceae bacterium]